MTADYWGRVERLFTAALERPAEERAPYVTSGGEAEFVQREVLSLLDGHADSGRLDDLSDRLQGIGGGAVSAAELLARLRRGVAGRYRVEDELGRGGMSIVYLARDHKHRLRPVALKVLRPTLALGLGPERFLDEIAIAAHLSHPHILPLHDSGEVPGTPPLLYYVMPLVEGESLRALLLRESRLPTARALEIARQVADALAYAHRRGVVHCDVKPDNILLTSGHAVITDFGIARAMSAAAAGDSPPTDPGMLLGTPGYMSPEQAARAPQLDGRSDVYSLGVVLYEMLAAPPPLDPALATIPEPLRAVIRRATAHDPAERYPTAADLALALALPEPSVTRPRPRRRRWTVAAAAAPLPLAGLGIAVALAHTRPSIDPAAAVMAVLPPVPTAPDDTALARLSRDLTVTLSADLDGVGEIRTVDPSATLIDGARRGGPLALDAGLRLGRRLGAGSVVYGTMVRESSLVRIDLGIFDTQTRRRLGRASVIAGPADLRALTDSITWALLRGIWRTRAPPTPDLAALTTRSLPALRAFLEGERLSLEGGWELAARAYATARQADPAFWLASWRYAYTRWWYLDAVDDSILQPLYAHRAALPERDRLVLESWWTDTIPAALARGRVAVERYPDYWPSWMQYADWLFHAGPVYGYERAVARAALERTLALNPAFLPAWEHLFWATIPDDAAAAAAALDSLIRLGLGPASIRENGFDITRVYRLDLAWARAARLDPGLLDSVARDIRRGAHRRVGGGANLLPVQVELSRRVLAGDPRPELRAVHERLLSDAWAGRGAWDSALVVADRLARRPDAGGDALLGYRVAVIGAWLGALSPDGAARYRAPAARAAGRIAASVMWRAELAWLDGILAAARRDPAALARARAAVQRADTVSSPVLDRSLAAFQMELAGRRSAAAGILATLNWPNPDMLTPGYAAHPYVIALSRLAAARWLAGTDRDSAAARVLMWFEAPWAFDGYRPARQVLAGVAARERARLAASQGDVELARARYAEFLSRHDRPVDAQRHLLDEARGALARLR